MDQSDDKDPEQVFLLPNMWIQSLEQKGQVLTSKTGIYSRSRSFPNLNQVYFVPKPNRTKKRKVATSVIVNFQRIHAKVYYGNPAYKKRNIPLNV